MPIIFYLLYFILLYLNLSCIVQYDILIKHVLNFSPEDHIIVSLTLFTKQDHKKMLHIRM